MNQNMIQMTVMLSEIKQCLMQLKKKAIMILKCPVEALVSERNKYTEHAIIKQFKARHMTFDEAESALYHVREYTEQRKLENT